MLKREHYIFVWTKKRLQREILFPLATKDTWSFFCSHTVRLGDCDLLLANIMPRDPWGHSLMWHLDRDRFVLLNLPAQIRLSRAGFVVSRKHVCLDGGPPAGKAKHCSPVCVVVFRSGFWCQKILESSLVLHDSVSPSVEGEKIQSDFAKVHGLNSWENLVLLSLP